MQCYECKVELSRYRTTEFFTYDKDVGCISFADMPVAVCHKCGMEWLTEDGTRMLAMEKARRIELQKKGQNNVTHKLRLDACRGMTTHCTELAEATSIANDFLVDKLRLCRAKPIDLTRRSLEGNDGCVGFLMSGGEMIATVSVFQYESRGYCISGVVYANTGG